MDPKTVAKLEGQIEEAIAEIIVKMGLKKLPLLPARHTMNLMAKAAAQPTKQKWKCRRSSTTAERIRRQPVEQIGMLRHTSQCL